VALHLPATISFCSMATKFEPLRAGAAWRRNSTIKEVWPFLGYFKAMHRTECTNRYADHRGHTHHVTGTTGGNNRATCVGEM
jgi:hypothetical protein